VQFNTLYFFTFFFHSFELSVVLKETEIVGLGDCCVSSYWTCVRAEIRRSYKTD